MRILIVEDDIELAENISILLRHESYAVDVATSFKDAEDKIANSDYDLVILDWKLGDGLGTDLCRQMRADSINTPVLILTSNSQVEDKVEGLDAGADDYLTKPFDKSELMARVRALNRRNVSAVSPKITLSDLEIDTNLRQVYRSGKTIDLSPREYALLEYLATRVGVAVSRIDLLTHVWDENANMFSNTVDVHIKYLRDKIDKGYKVKLIRTIKGKGYAICLP